MDLLLVLEHHFYKDRENNVWCDRVVNREFVERYLSVFEDITICARISDIDKAEDNFHKISGQNTYFLELPDSAGFKKILTKIPKMKRIFNRECKKYNTVIFRAPSPLSLILYRQCIKQNKVGVEFVMGADKFFSGNSIISKFMNTLVVYEAKRLCFRANGVSYVTSEYLQKIYPSYSIKYGEDSKHIDSYYSSVDLKDFNFIEKKWSSNEKPKIFKILHIGYMDSDRKGHEILIKTIAKIIDYGFNIEATFIGDGKLKGQFQELAEKLGVEKNINFYGATNNKKEIAEILGVTHLFVLPSNSEGLPRVIIEAMASSTPCIASGVDGIPELIDNKCIVNSFNSDDYANKIIEFLSDWEMMVRFSELNFKNAKFYHTDYLSKKRYDFYDRLKRLES